MQCAWLSQQCVRVTVLSVSVIHNGVVVHASIPEWAVMYVFAVQTMVL